MIYTAKLKTRKEMERTIQRGLLGWWHDVCAGQTLELREATPEDLARCSLKEASSRNPADYLCENIDRGSLVLREAIAVLTPWTDEQMDREVRKAIDRLGAERFRTALRMSAEEKPHCWINRDGGVPRVRLDPPHDISAHAWMPLFTCGVKGLDDAQG